MRCSSHAEVFVCDKEPLTVQSCVQSAIVTSLNHTIGVIQLEVSIEVVVQADSCLVS